MDVAQGILTARGGMTSHAAVVARGMGVPCVAGCDILIDEKKRTVTFPGGKILKGGDFISLDGSKGEVYEGELKTIRPDLTSGDFGRFMNLADKIRSSRSAPTPTSRATPRWPASSAPKASASAAPSTCSSPPTACPTCRR